MESYVLRVYRRDGATLVGTVEGAIRGHQSSFQSADDLWRALAGSADEVIDPRDPQPVRAVTPVSAARRKKARSSTASRIATRKPHAQRTSS